MLGEVAEPGRVPAGRHYQCLLVLQHCLRRQTDWRPPSRGGRHGADRK